MKSLSLTLRALIALLLMVMFYLFALSVSGGLLLIPYAEWESGTLHLKVDAICIISALLILWAIMPRRNKFVQPGPELKKEEHPKLFELIENVAYSTKQKMPEAVYLILDMNAWVSEKGGFLGFNKKRIMGIGLPLMQTMNISELEAIIAHEFGHYYGGDTKLSPIIFKTRGAIERTLQHFEESLLQIPFRMYAKLFFRITHGISRHQEYCADRVAAETAGAKPFITGMEKLNEASLKFDYYWQNEVVHLLNCGVKPAIAEGFEKCQKSKNVSEILKEDIKNLEDEYDPYSTHPPIKDRIEAVRYLDNGYTRINDESAITLINNIENLEKKALAIIYGEEGVILKESKWENLTVEVYLKAWSEYIEKYKAYFNEIKFCELYKETTNLWSSFNERIREKDKNFSLEEVKNIGEGTVGIAVMQTLEKNGWKFEKVAGEEVIMRNGNESIEPMLLVENFRSEKINEAEWNKIVEKNGLGNILISLN